MHDIRAMVFDLDGTLLDMNSCLSPANQRALQICLTRGILLYVATARPHHFMYCLGNPPGQIAFLGARGVFYNGALAIDEPLGYRQQWTMPAQMTLSVVDDLVAVAGDLHIAIQLPDDGHAFRLPMDDRALSAWAVPRKELRSFGEACRRSCLKIVAWHETLLLADAYAQLRARYGHTLNVFLTDDGHVLQCMDACATKEDALLDLLCRQGVSPSQVAVFGDGPTDAGMFRTFAYSIAMGNASPEVKAAATYITGSYREDGVAQAIRSHLGIV